MSHTDDWGNQFFDAMEKEATVPAKNFVATMAANVDNPNLTDADFRDMFRTTLPIVEYKDKRRK